LCIGVVLRLRVETEFEVRGELAGVLDNGDRKALIDLAETGHFSFESGDASLKDLVGFV
jgi:hypothetical protein